MEDILFKKLSIIRTSSIGSSKYFQLLDKYKDINSVYEYINPSYEHKNNILKEIELSNKYNIKYLSYEDEFYPQLLKSIKNPPPVICYRGNIETLKKNTVAIVGTRHASHTGLSFAYNLAKKFSENNYVVVSGMAIGTDSLAHKGALSIIGNNQTIAVLAGGIDYIWPIENESLYYEIIERGCVISEMPTGFKPKPNNFIQRNRIIAGLAEKLILGEADLKSGSLATANFMISYKRPVFAIPSHPYDSRSLGPNTLIKEQKAKIITGIDDFFHTTIEKNKKNIELSEIQKNILDVLNSIPVSESVLTRIVKKHISEIKQNLVTLELKGLIKKEYSGYIKIIE